MATPSYALVPFGSTPISLFTDENSRLFQLNNATICSTNSSRSRPALPNALEILSYCLSSTPTIKTLTELKVRQSENLQCLSQSKRLGNKIALRLFNFDRKSENFYRAQDWHKNSSTLASFFLQTPVPHATHSAFVNLTLQDWSQLTPTQKAQSLRGVSNKELKRTFEVFAKQMKKELAQIKKAVGEFGAQYNLHMLSKDRLNEFLLLNVEGISENVLLPPKFLKNFYYLGQTLNNTKVSTAVEVVHFLNVLYSTAKKMERMNVVLKEWILNNELYAVSRTEQFRNKV